MSGVRAASCATNRSKVVSEAGPLSEPRTRSASSRRSFTLMVSVRRARAGAGRAPEEDGLRRRQRPAELPAKEVENDSASLAHPGAGIRTGLLVAHGERVATPFWASKSVLSSAFLVPCVEVFTSSTEQNSRRRWTDRSR